MKKLQLFIAFASLFIGIHASAQFTVNSNPCEGDTVKISAASLLYSGLCDGHPENYLQTTYYRFLIINPQNVSYSVVSGTQNIYTTENTLKLKVQSTSYTNPATLEIRVQRWKVRNDGSGAMDMCTEEPLFITPKKKMTFSGPSVLEDPGPVAYSVTNVPGVTFNWTYPSTWAVSSSNSNHSSMVFSVGGSASYAPISVSSTPTIFACNTSLWPVTNFMVDITPCYYNGTTLYNYCAPDYNWGNILATTNFQDYPNELPRMMGDFNGDDKDDLIGFGYSGVIVGLSTGSNFNYNTWTSALTNGNGGYNQKERPRMVGDFNGDGKDDIIGFGYSGATVALSNGLSFSTSGFSASPYFGYDQGFTGPHLPRFVGDFNGDGKTDIMGCGHSSTSVGLSNGTSFDVTSWSGGATFSSTAGGFAGDPDDNDPDAPEDTDKYPRMVGDFDGDGKTDIIGFGHTDVSVGLSTGSSFDVSTWTHSFTYGNDGILQSTTPRGIGDFDGDGKDDIILFGHTAVSVGISNGTGFDVSVWTDQDFIVDEGWTNIQISAMGIGNRIVIYDLNHDGKDDLVGLFVGTAYDDPKGTYVAYSTGSGFQCADFSPNVLDLESNRETIFAGNFDNRDDEAELVEIHTNYIEVLDCENCVTSVANASMMRHYAVATETSGSNSVSVYKYCIEDSVGIDLSAAHCEDSYYLEIKPYNLSTGTAGTAVYQTGWIPRNAPKKVDFSALNLPTNQLYQVTFGVGPNTSTKTLYFRITGPVANLTITPNQTRTVTNNFGTFTINQYCTNVVSFSLNGTASNCYDEYRYSIFEVAAPFFVPAYGVPPVLQIPASGGWNPGPVATQNINMSNIVSGKVYKIIFYVRKNGVTSTYERLVERNSCIAPPPKSLVIDQGTESISEPTSILYPNPMTNYIIVNPAGYDEEEITGDIYDAYGKLVGSTILESGKDNTIELLHVSPGIYLIVLQGNNRNEKLSFIKQ